MALFPQIGNAYITETDRAMRSRLEASYAEAITINQAYWNEAYTDLRFYSGDETLWNDIFGNLPVNRRRQFNFNRIRRIINMVQGHQRRNRRTMVVTPIENGDSLTTDQFNKVLMNVNQQANTYESISEAFLGALICGLNFIHITVDYRNDPVSGNIKLDVLPYSYFIMDPFFKKHDLSDCNYVWSRSYVTKRECLSLMPSREEEIMALQGNTYSGTGKDGKFMFTPESFNYSMKNLLAYDEYYYKDFRTQKMLVDTETGETQEWRSKDEDKLKLFLQTYRTITVIEHTIPTVNMAIAIQGKVFYDGPNLQGLDSYPMVPFFGYYHPELVDYPWKIQGMTRNLRDAQYLYNRRRIIELDILESQISSGFKYKENALVNPEDVFLQGQGKGLALKQEAAMTDVERIPAPDIPASMIQLSELLAKDVQEISGVSEELLGMADDSKAGILSMLRQGASLTGLQVLFDQLDQSQKALGDKFIQIIQNNYMPGKIKKILEGAEPTDQFYNKAFGKYHCVVEDGILTSTQRQMQFAQLLHLREAGIPIPNDMLLETCTLQNKQELIKAVKDQEQAQQQAQMSQMQGQMQLQKAQAELAQARAMADQGLYAERTSRVAENRALAIQKIHEANKDDEMALLNKVKALKELEDMDLGHIERLLNMANLLKAQEKAASEREPIQERPLA